MFVYEKRLQYPIKIKNPNPKLAALIISQYGGPYIIRLQKTGEPIPGFHLSHFSFSMVSIICSNSFGLLTWTGHSALMRPSSLVVI